MKLIGFSVEHFNRKHEKKVFVSSLMLLNLVKKCTRDTL